MGLHLLLVVFNWRHLSQDYLLLCTQQNQPVVEASHESLHLVFYPASAVVLL
jgi:hypothetical protein